MALLCRNNAGGLITCTTDSHTEGSTYCIGGIDECEVTITYNYTQIFDIHQIHGLTGEQSLPILQEGIDRLGTERAESYWDPTPGNVGHMLSILAKWATEHPEGIWEDEDQRQSHPLRDLVQAEAE
jgi:hypothetical protein